jgi:hypothetical protein
MLMGDRALLKLASLPFEGLADKTLVIITINEFYLVGFHALT